MKRRTLSREQFQEFEETFIRHRRAGVSMTQLVYDLDLTQAEADRMESIFKLQAIQSGGCVDSSTPRFADHSGHLRAVMAAGGFGAFSEKRLPQGGVACCLPVVYPARAA